MQHDFWTNTEDAIRRAYITTDNYILEQSIKLGKGGSTAVTAILINCEKLVVANVGDSRAVICKKGVAKQLSIDHEPSKEKKIIESKGGFVSNLPGNLSLLLVFGDFRVYSKTNDVLLLHNLMTCDLNYVRLGIYPYTYNRYYECSHYC